MLKVNTEFLNKFILIKKRSRRFFSGPRFVIFLMAYWGSLGLALF